MSNQPLPLIGDVVELLHMPDDIDPIESGALGVVTAMGTQFPEARQIHVAWDNGRDLMLLHGIDHYRVVAAVGCGQVAARHPMIA